MRSAPLAELKFANQKIFFHHEDSEKEKIIFFHILVSHNIDLLLNLQTQKNISTPLKLRTQISAND